MFFKLGELQFSKLSFEAAKQRISNIIENGSTCQQIIIANVYSLFLSYRNKEFANVCKKADLVFADGMPIVWVSRIFKNRLPERVAGPDFMWEFSEVCAQKGYKVFLLGGYENTIESLVQNLRNSFPIISITGYYSPPFGKWSKEENQKITRMINESGAQILWLGVSTPKQDIWISENKFNLNTKVAIGVGAAFDFHAGKIKRAPLWMQKTGFEWFFRLLQEPSRMWKRYLISNTIFVILVFIEVLKVGKRKIFVKK